MWLKYFLLALTNILNQSSDRSENDQALLAICWIAKLPIPVQDHIASYLGSKSYETPYEFKKRLSQLEQGNKQTTLTDFADRTIKINNEDSLVMEDSSAWVKKEFRLIRSALDDESFFLSAYDDVFEDYTVTLFSLSQNKKNAVCLKNKDLFVRSLAQIPSTTREFGYFSLTDYGKNTAEVEEGNVGICRRCDEKNTQGFVCTTSGISQNGIIYFRTWAKPIRLLGVTNNGKYIAFANNNQMFLAKTDSKEYLEIYKDDYVLFNEDTMKDQTTWWKGNFAALAFNAQETLLGFRYADHCCKEKFEYQQATPVKEKIKFVRLRPEQQWSFADYLKENSICSKAGWKKQCDYWRNN